MVKGCDRMRILSGSLVVPREGAPRLSYQLTQMWAEDLKAVSKHKKIESDASLQVYTNLPEQSI